ncbi:STM3941 family protein [Myceligenerans indicum]|uniref:PH domain-containing protein n=1 Tax=Myceligenerans indicum TaxID=2593663 RepID=A0ABS1LIV7_9MICO|nr:STM3941 family protein [Myceligenerans indicum]MBL0886169.1 hypothetical protein [Myceligenerans indicum]
MNSSLSPEERHTDADEDPVVFPTNRSYLKKVALLGGPAMTLASGAIGWFGVADLLGAETFVPFWFAPIGIFAFLFFAYGWWFAIRRLTVGGGGLRIGPAGIESFGVGAVRWSVPWSDVEWWYIGYVSSQEYLHVVVRDPDEYIAREANPLKRLAGRMNVRLVGTPVSVALSTVDAPPGAIAEAMVRYSGIDPADDDEPEALDNDAAHQVVSVPGRKPLGRRHQWLWAGFLLTVVGSSFALHFGSAGRGIELGYALLAQGIAAALLLIMVVRDMLHDEADELVACVRTYGGGAPVVGWIPTSQANEVAAEVRRGGVEAWAAYHPIAVGYWAVVNFVGATLGIYGVVSLGERAVEPITSWALIIGGAIMFLGIAEAPRTGWFRRRVLRMY